MPFIAIIGSGALGGAIAHTLALRDHLPEVRLIDASGAVARGKALDIQQSGPVDSFNTRVTAADSIEAAAGAAVVVVADAATGNVEHAGDAGLGLVRQLTRAGCDAPLLFAGATQSSLMAMAVTELHVARRRVLGSAPLALESALRALAGLAIDGSAVEVSLRVVGVPPRNAIVAWETSTAYGRPLSSALPPHAIAGLSARIPGLWPPGPYALGAAAARVAEAVAAGIAQAVLVFRGGGSWPGARGRHLDASRARADGSSSRARAGADQAGTNRDGECYSEGGRGLSRSLSISD